MSLKPKDSKQSRLKTKIRVFGLHLVFGLKCIRFKVIIVLLFIVCKEL